MNKKLKVLVFVSALLHTQLHASDCQPTQLTWGANNSCSVLSTFVADGDSRTLISPPRKEAGARMVAYTDTKHSEAISYTDTKATQTLNSANSYTNTKSAETLTSANSYANTRANQALASANSYTDNKANQTLASANSYTDSKATQTLNSANSYTNSKSTETLNSANSYTDTKSSQTLNSANAYTDSKATATLNSANTYTNNSSATTLANSKSYTDSKSASTLTAANDYTDQSLSSLEQSQSATYGPPVTQSVATEYNATSNGLLVVVPNGACSHSYHDIVVGGQKRASAKAYQEAGSLATTTTPIYSGENYKVVNTYGCNPESIKFYPLG